MAEAMIYPAICGVMQDIGVVGKDSTNRQQGYKYRSIDDVMNALNPAMIKHKIFCIPEVLEQNREERTTKNGTVLIYSVCRIRYKFFATDGSFVEAVVVGEGMDSGDKATNKAMAVAFKYACFQTFCIPTESLMDDSDATTPEQSKRAEPSARESRKTEPSSREKKRKELDAELKRTGYTNASVCKKYKVDTIDSLSEEQLADCIAKMRSQVPDKGVSR